MPQHLTKIRAVGYAASRHRSIAYVRAARSRRCHRLRSPVPPSKPHRGVTTRSRGGNFVVPLCGTILYIAFSTYGIGGYARLAHRLCSHMRYAHSMDAIRCTRAASRRKNPWSAATHHKNMCGGICRVAASEHSLCARRA